MDFCPMRVLAPHAKASAITLVQERPPPKLSRPADLQSSLTLVRGSAYRSTATRILSGSPFSTLPSVRSRALRSRIGISVCIYQTVSQRPSGACHLAATARPARALQRPRLGAAARGAAPLRLSLGSGRGLITLWIQCPCWFCERDAVRSAAMTWESCATIPTRGWRRSGPGGCTRRVAPWTPRCSSAATGSVRPPPAARRSPA
jgi:hypothetical protein